MPQKDIGGLYAQALKGSLKNLTTQVREGLLKQNFDRAIQGTAPTVPLMETVPAPTVVKAVPTLADPSIEPIQEQVIEPIQEQPVLDILPEVLPVEVEPEIPPPTLKVSAAPKPAPKSIQSGSIT